MLGRSIAHHNGEDNSEWGANAEAQVGVVWPKENRDEQGDIAARQCPESLGSPKGCT